MPKEKPTIKSSFEYKGNTYSVEWYDADTLDEPPEANWTQVYGVCFYQGRVVLVECEYDRENLPGGGIEPGEEFGETFAREMVEETNMKVLSWRPLGYQIIGVPDGDDIYQLRVVADVEPIGEFQKDPAGKVTGNKLVEPEKVNEYIDYGEIGDHIVQRAIKIHDNMQG